MSLNDLTAEKAMELLDYNAETGIFVWRERTGSRFGGKVAGYKNKYGYLCIYINRYQYKAHRLAWLITHGVWPSWDIDHINGDKTDNRIANLRDVTRSVNCQNKRKARVDNALGVLGVQKTRHGGYASSIFVNGRQIFIGTFESAELAAAAYLGAKRVIHLGNTL